MTSRDDILTPQQLAAGFHLQEVSNTVLEVRRSGIRVASFQPGAEPEMVRATVDLIMSEDARLRG